MRFASLRDKVIVITGASSGIGKLAAEEFLKRGAMIVLAARSLEPMQQHLAEIGADEQTAIAVQADVSNPDQVKALAETACNHFGRVDVWINNAAVSLYGPTETLMPDEVDRVVDVNLKGQIFGSQEAIRIFKNQGYGNLINVGSALGKGSAPLQSVYTAAKHGIVGFSSCLREELLNDPLYKYIDVSAILPASMDTPLFRHAKSKMGVEPYPIPPVYDPMVTVRAILRCAMNPEFEIVAGRAGGTMVWAYRLFPGLLEKYMGKTAFRQQLTKIPKSVEGEDNLFAPMPDAYGTRGGIGTTGEHIRDSLAKHPVRTGTFALLPVVIIAAGVLAGRRLLSARA